MALRHNITNDPWALAFGRQQIRRLREQLLDDEPNEDDHMISRVYRVGGRTIQVRLMGENEFIYLAKRDKPARPTYHVLTWNFEKQRYEPFDEENGKFDREKYPFVVSAPSFVPGAAPSFGDHWSANFLTSQDFANHSLWASAITHGDREDIDLSYEDDVIRVFWDDGTRLPPVSHYFAGGWNFPYGMDNGVFVLGRRWRDSGKYMYSLSFQLFTTGYESSADPRPGFRHTQGFKVEVNAKYVSTAFALFD